MDCRTNLLTLALAFLLFQAAECLAEDHPISSGNESSQPGICVVLIGGIDSDPSPEQIAGTARRGEGQSGMYQLAGDLAGKGLAAEYFNWNGTRAGKINHKAPFSAGIVQWIREWHAQFSEQRLTVIANSWGCHTAWEVCEGLREIETPIELVLFLDPSSAGRAKTIRPMRLPKCIKAAPNYYTRNIFGWREWPGELRIVNVDLGDPKRGFLVEGGPKYDSPFDLQAHIGAEWDQRIHQEFAKHLEELLNGPGSDVTPTPKAP